ncbi:Guanine nucleotide-binding protein G(o) subunit alpha [Entophlyctis sp. JEL0112]|nr:Guanine nucleotide-binding protein G(o) subunit alpha [Entophlyctis sp. JEL0112]
MGSCASTPSGGASVSDTEHTRFGATAEKKDAAADAQAQVKRSKQIDKQLAEASKDSTIKVLLLGTAETGKSTVLKQLRIIHGGGFSSTDIEVYRSAVRRNIYDMMRGLTDAMKLLHIPYGFDPATARISVVSASRTSLVELMPAEGSQQQQQKSLAVEAAKIYAKRGDVAPACDASSEAAIRKAVACIRGSAPDFSTSLSADIVAAVKLLWNDPGIRYCFSRGHEFNMLDLSYFLNDVDRFNSLSYTPTNQDILSLRIMTSGVYETVVVINKNVFKVYDVGGQKSERRKWIHVFDNVNAIFFLFDTSAYNLFTVEDASVNRSECKTDDPL